MASIVVAQETVHVSHAGQRWRITRGDAWDATDPLVKAFPDLFASDARVVHRSERGVEQATAAPGEKRKTRRA